ncbi:hypothetical protein CORC01_04803 [Colletotrichum orchidophilum]|uniref:C4-dicarboxylate transporter/malic acid transporter n=1 Tax=Colletotrichum orchidophilum TaxID=1209926 RepID=A0A1G4BF28_9PEZI|nr:uncharacterized protein CORC01_04803 [Colletotrichum orchidophilum]OHE99902.1 hypothetical protein CORC01_04803 [Colletotrichum orchidophilum]
MPLVLKPDDDLSSQTPTTHESSTLRSAIRDFSSQWFLIPQGTGITATVLHQLDYRFHGLTEIAYVFWVTTTVLLLLMLCLYGARVALYPKRLLHALKHDDAELAGLSSISITFTSVVQTASLALVRGAGEPWSTVLHVLWWVSFALAATSIVFLPFVFIKVYPPGVAQLSPSTQLAVTAALTAAAAGGTICTSAAALSSARQIPIIVVSYLLIGMGLPLAFALDVLFWARLLGNYEPPKEKAFQDMILCGPWGQASYALQILGQAVVNGSGGAFLTLDDATAATAAAAAAVTPVGYVSIFAGLVTWGLGTYWWIFAILGVFRAFFERGWRPASIPYTLAGWAVVFPWGVYTNAALELGKIMGSRAFRLWSTCLAMMLVLIWLVNVGLTLKMLLNKCKIKR